MIFNEKAITIGVPVIGITTELHSDTVGRSAESILLSVAADLM